MTAAPVAAVSPRDDLDVFISYAGVDRGWVNDTLKPRLEGASISVLTDVTFVPGRCVFDNIYDAIARARFMIAVLSPEWFESDFAPMEGHFKIYSDMAQSVQTLLPIVRREAELPEYMNQFTFVEMRDDAEFEANVGRIITAITLAKAIAPCDAEAVRQEIDDFGDLLHVDDVRQAFERYRPQFEEASRQIIRLGDFKDVHDTLHKLQAECVSVFIPTLPQREDGYNGWPAPGIDDLLTLHVDTYRDLVATLKTIAGRPTFAARPLEFIATLGQSQEMLADSLTEGNARRAITAVKLLDHVLASEAMGINRDLNEAARAVQLRVLALSVGQVIDDGRRRGVAEEQLEVLARGARALETLNRVVDALVRDHAYWQDADVELRMVEKTFSDSVDDLLVAWPGVKRKLGIVVRGEEPWAADLQATREKVEVQLTTRDPHAARTFKVLRQQAVRRFIQVDHRLLEQCRQMRKVGRKLEQAL